ncbi:hypothetical protein CsSME_00028973 [Camellia sinensis var. sinensis]
MRVCGEKNVLELTLVSFLKPETLKQYVGKIDEEVRKHMERHWHGKNEVKVMPLMKTLTFNIIFSLIFGIEQEARKDALRGLFQNMIKGMLSVPMNLSFTRFNHSLRARAKMKTILMDLTSEKRVALEKNGASPHQDLSICLLSIHNEDNSALLSDKEIEDNAVIIMIGGYDTSSILLTFLIRLLANEPSIYATIVQDPGELLTWDDLSKMKYTWRVAMETLRITPPGFCSFKRVLKDTEFGGCPIPKGWQVLVWATSMTHMDEIIFPNPSKINATRFEQQAPATCCFMAFGRPRMCPGYEFTRIETLLSCIDNSFCKDPMPIFNQGLPIHIKPKKSNGGT